MAIAVAANPQKIAEDPTYAGFVTWVHSVMGVPDQVMRDISILDPYLEMAYDTSINMTYIGLKLVQNRAPYRFLVREPPTPPPVVTPPIVEPPEVSHPIQPTPPTPLIYQTMSIYSVAVYNLGGHVLCEIAVDDPNLPPPFNTFWADLRQRLGMNSMSLGIVTCASDQGTSAGQQIPSQIMDMTLMGLSLLKTPWGRMYLMIAGQWGAPPWGIS